MVRASSTGVRAARHAADTASAGTSRIARPVDRRTAGAARRLPRPRTPSPPPARSLGPVGRVFPSDDRARRRHCLTDGSDRTDTPFCGLNSAVDSAAAFATCAVASLRPPRATSRMSARPRPGFPTIGVRPSDATSNRPLTTTSSVRVRRSVDRPTCPFASPYDGGMGRPFKRTTSITIPNQ